ncbi:MAG TPA: DUF481 domain-containing protein [Cyclobacteriaceae bacterium]|nr:DUF481 domain-containing protein [Cyclobacteriaceae bacterium]
MFRNLLISFLFIFPSLLSAQILNMEKLRLEQDTAKSLLAKAVIGLTANNRSGAEDEPAHLFAFNFDVNLMHYPGKHAYILVSKFDYLRVNEEGVMNYGYFHGRSNFLRERKFNYETFVQYSFDNARGLDTRWIVGGGLRHDLFKTDKTTLLIGIGGMFETEKWRYPKTERLVQKELFKSSNYLSFQSAVNEYIDLNLVNYYQTGYDADIEGFRNRLTVSLILNAKLTDRLSLTNSFDLAYEDKPIIPITKLIYTLKTGISINL